MQTNLRQHQKEALEFLSNKSSAGLFFEMGLGKTLIMLEDLNRKRQLPALIVCPLSVVSVWARESKKFGYNFKFQSLTGSFHERLDALSKPADVYVINFEGLRIIQEQLKQKGFKTLIVDEAHRVKERSSIQTKITLDLSDIIPNKYILTGTPVTKSPEDIWTQMEVVAPQSLGNFYSFRGRYINFKPITIYSPDGKRTIKKPVSYKNLKELEGKISEFCLRKTKKECLSDLPEKIYKTIDCHLDGDQLKAYYELKNSLSVAIAEDKHINISHAATLIQKLRQVCQGFLYDTDHQKTIYFKSNAKLNILKDLLEDLSQEKVIVFGLFKAEMEFLYKELTKSKSHKVLLYQGNAEERGQIEKEFQESTEPAIFLAQIETAKEGITLTSASHVIYFSNSWSYATRKQSEDRAHRVGQVNNVVYYDFIAPQTVDELVYDALQMKGDVADKITGDSVRLAKLICESS